MTLLGARHYTRLNHYNKLNHYTASRYLLMTLLGAPAIWTSGMP